MLEFLTPIFCAVGLLTCPADITEPNITDEVKEFVSSVTPVEPEEIKPVVTPHKISNKISSQSWDRAMELRPLLVEIVEKEFGGDMIWLGVMVALCHTESRCNPNATSWVGAEGAFQWMPSSAKAFAATDCRDLGKANRRENRWAGFCAARHLKQNLRIVKVHNTKCDMINIGALRGYNEGPGNTKRAQRSADDPGDTNSVSLVSWKSPANELQTDQYPVKIMAKWFREYRLSNYFDSPDPCINYEFNTHGVSL